MLASAERHGLHDAHRFVAIDLGMLPAQRRRLEQRFPWCDIRDFEASSYPPHVADLSTFAWKPIAIAEADVPSGEFLLWFDSGTIFHARLDRMIDAVRSSGVYSLAGQTALGDCCDERTLQALGVVQADRREPYRAGGVLGFDPAKRTVRAVLQRWRQCALDRQCIAPEGLDRRVHRFDQAILTAILCGARREAGLPIGADEIDISSTKPVRFVSTRNKVPAWMPTALDPAIRAYYMLWKRADRAVLRLKARGRRREGWYPRASQD